MDKLLLAFIHFFKNIDGRRYPKLQAKQESTAIGSMADAIESKILTIRGMQVMIDRW